MQVNAANLYLLDRAGQSKTNGIFTGYARANNQRLAQLFDRTLNSGTSPVQGSQAVQNAQGLNPPMVTTISPTRPKVLTFEDSAFLKNYRNNMLDLQTAAARVRSSEAGEGIPVAMSADPTVAEARGRMENASDQYEVTVEQLASGQVSQSEPLSAQDPLPTASGSLRLETGKGKFSFFMSGAGMEDNREMLENFAVKLNSQDTGVTASVVEREGTVSLRLENSAGEKGSFVVSGTLQKRLNIQETQAAGEQEAVYTIKKNGGEAERHTSEKNTVELDKGISLKLKGEGSTKVTAASDILEGVAEKLSLLVEKFNSTRDFLSRNGENRQGVQNQLRRMSNQTVPEKSMSLIGVTAQKDGSYSFDREAFLSQARRTPDLVSSIAEDFSKGIQNIAQRGMRESSGSLVGPVEYGRRMTETQQNPVNVLSTYSKNGVHNLMNFYAAGVLMNLNV